MSSTARSSTVILGSGIIGVATAYYLSELRPPTEEGHEIHLVENSGEMFASASGKAGGFLAEDWFPAATASLGALSFKLHKDLAAKHNGREKWGYTPSTGSSYAVAPSPIVDGRKARGDDWLRNGESRSVAASNSSSTPDGEIEGVDSGDGPAWLKRRDGDEYEAIGATNSTAQLDPLKLCQFLLDECIKRGVVLHQPYEATSVIRDPQNRITDIALLRTTTSKSTSGENNPSDRPPTLTLPCTNLVLAAGAWTPRIHDTLFPTSNLNLRISSLAGHSIVLRHAAIDAAYEARGCHAVFGTHSSGSKPTFAPELFSRIGGEVFVGGLNSSTLPLPRRADESVVSDAAIEELVCVARDMCGFSSSASSASGDKAPSLSDMEILRTGVCFRPVTERGVPILARVLDHHDEKVDEDPGRDDGGCGSVFVAAGHGPWGISLSLGSGLVVAEMILGRDRESEGLSCDVGALGL